MNPPAGKPLNTLETTMLASAVLLTVSARAGVKLDDAREVVRAVAKLDDYDRGLLIASAKRRRP